MILLNDSFSALVPAFLEGQRIVSGMGDILRLFLSRTFSVALIILAAGMIRLPFPTKPAHEFLYSLVAVGIPTFFLAIWAKPKQPKQRLFVSVLPFVIPAITLIMMFGLVIYAAAYFAALRGLLPVEVTAEQIARYETFAGFQIRGEMELKSQIAGMVSRSALSWFNNLVGILLLIFVVPPIRFFVAERPLSQDKKPALLAILLLILLIAVFAIEPLRQYFELVALRRQHFVVITLLVIVWFFILRLVWRRRWLSRFLQVSFDD
jgi:cation-transporting ATPase E